MSPAARVTRYLCYECGSACEDAAALRRRRFWNDPIDLAQRASWGSLCPACGATCGDRSQLVKHSGNVGNNATSGSKRIANCLTVSGLWNCGNSTLQWSKKELASGTIAKVLRHVRRPQVGKGLEGARHCEPPSVVVTIENR
eukprot:3117640-Pyramimonas_sp.AAC.1